LNNDAVYRAKKLKIKKNFVSNAIADVDYIYDINNRIIEFASPKGVTIYNYETEQLTIADL
jgi:hypothetical protein